MNRLTLGLIDNDNVLGVVHHQTIYQTERSWRTIELLKALEQTLEIDPIIGVLEIVKYRDFGIIKSKGIRSDEDLSEGTESFTKSSLSGVQFGPFEASVL